MKCDKLTSEFLARGLTKFSEKEEDNYNYTRLSQKATISKEGNILNYFFPNYQLFTCNIDFQRSTNLKLCRGGGLKRHCCG